MYALPCCQWFLAFVDRGVLAICAKYPNLPNDRAVIRVEQEMRSVLALYLFW